MLGGFWVSGKEVARSTSRHGFLHATWPLNCDVWYKDNCINLLFYFQGSHIQINPKGIVAIGPDIDYSVPHDRATRLHNVYIHVYECLIVCIHYTRIIK